MAVVFQPYTITNKLMFCVCAAIANIWFSVIQHAVYSFSSWFLKTFVVYICIIFRLNFQLFDTHFLSSELTDVVPIDVSYFWIYVYIFMYCHSGQSCVDNCLLPWCMNLSLINLMIVQGVVLWKSWIRSQFSWLVHDILRGSWKHWLGNSLE